MFDEIIKSLRDFFQTKLGYTEIPAQSELSILSACEDPATIVKFEFQGKYYPLPQTGQMRLEEALLKNPCLKGVFCQTTSYRNEPHPIKGRHDLIFTMFEFEGFGEYVDLLSLELELLEYLGFPQPIYLQYETACKECKSKEIGFNEEEYLCKKHPVISLLNFPRRTHPFWNMRRNLNGTYQKIDVLLYGMETIGSAVRSCYVNEMRDLFCTVSDGEYMKLLFDTFGEERVMQELNDYLSLPMIPRFGGGIGITRLLRALKFIQSS